MKKPEEYLKELFDEPFNYEEGSIDLDFLNIIKRVQEDTVNHVIKTLSENWSTIQYSVKEEVIKKMID